MNGTAVISQRSSMLNLVRRTCDGGRDMPDFEGVYEPDEEQVTAWAEPTDVSYDGVGRFVNLGPAKVKILLTAATEPDDIRALKVAFDYWQRNGGYAAEGIMEAGTVYRGEPRQAIVAGSMRELAAAVRPVQAITVFGSLAAGGIPRATGQFLGLDVIDYGELAAMGPPPMPAHDEDWF